MTEEEDSEKRFHSVMDKLFNSPKPNSISRGKKRAAPNDDSGGLTRSLLPARSMAPPVCRPWDRGDLMRRLATFKSMTWFGKPKVVSAVNCARRGWINVEMDIIACEACGARLLFSNPSSWTQQQIEKAAAVFSLKLDNGHKPLCPWIDNACDELLVQFPPTPARDLIDGYRKRSSALLRLSALPIVSSSTIDLMRCPQLDCFLEQSAVDLGIGCINTTRIEYLDHERAASADLYYQAQKLISLCGWEPRTLPYAVDCKNWSCQPVQIGHSEETSPHIANARNPEVVMYSMSGIDDVVDVEEGPSRHALQSDPASVVLDCKLCGASAGLWAFSTVPRPLEWFRIFESLEVNGNSGCGGGDVNANGCIAGAPRLDESGKNYHVGSNGGTVATSSATKEKSVSLNLSIGGGPSPAKQTYRATVSLPIISRHLRATFSSKPHAGYHLMSNASIIDPETVQCTSVDTNILQQENDQATPCKLIVQPENSEILTQNENEDGIVVSIGHDKDYDRSLEGCYVTDQGVFDTCPESQLENSVENSQKMPQSSDRNDGMEGSTENAEMGGENGTQGKECNAIANGTVENRNLNEDDVFAMPRAEVSDHQSDEVSSEAREVSGSFSSSSEANMVVDIACTMNLQKDDIGSYHQRALDVEGANGNSEAVKNTVQLAVNNEEGNKEMVEGVKNAVQLTPNYETVATHELVKNLKRVQVDGPMEFDPIRQHRHFCPWIVSAGKTGPGWRVTLSALDIEKVSSCPSLPHSPSSSMLEVDDPITSIRNLFKSPSAKRLKTSHDPRKQ